MKLKNTFFFFVFVICLGGFTYYLEFYRPEQNEKEESRSSQIIDLIKDQISELKISKTSEVIHLKKSIDGWDLISPVHDLANNESIDSFLTDLVDEKSKEMAKEGADINWKFYGLDHPEAIIEVQANSGQKIKISISNLSNFEGNVYLRRDNDSKVLVGAGSWRTFASKISMEFRDKRFLRGRVASVDSLVWNNGKESSELLFKDNQWQLKGAQFEVDANRVKDFLGWIDQVKVTEFMTLDGLNADMKSKYKANKYKCQIVLKLKDKTWTAKIYQESETAYWAYLFEENRFVRLNSPDLDKIIEVNKNYFRDHKMAFSVNTNELAQVKYEGPLKKWTLIKSEGKDQKNLEAQWLLKDSGSDLELDQAKVKSFFESIGKLEAGDFLGKSSSYKMKHALIFQPSKNSSQNEVKIEWGDGFKKKMNKVEKLFYPVKTSLISEVLTVEASLIDALSYGELVKAKKAASDSKIKEDKK